MNPENAAQKDIGPHIKRPAVAEIRDNRQSLQLYWPRMFILHLFLVFISFSALAEQVQHSTDAQLELAHVLAWKKDYTSSEAIYFEILRKTPNNFEAELGLAQVLFWDNQLKNSLEHLNWLVKAQPNNNEVTSLRQQVEQALKSQNIFFIRFAGDYQHFSFFDHDSWGGKSFFSYTSPKKWAVRGNFLTLSKFDTMSYQGSLGGTYWFTNTTVLSVDAETSPSSSVLPEQAYLADITQLLWGMVTPSFSYRFAQYQSASINTVSPGLLLQLSRQFELRGKYYLSMTHFVLQPNQAYENNAQKSSGFASVTFIPTDWVQGNLGYALGSEAFDSGNPVTGLSSFSYQDIFVGAKFLIKQQFGIDFTVDQQFRNNGFTVTSAELGLSYLW